MDPLNGMSSSTTKAYIYGANDDEESYFFKRLNQLRSASDSLSKAADEAPTAAKQQILNSMLKQCEMMNNALYTGRSWNTLMKVYAKAKGISLKDNPSLQDLKKAISEMSAALAALEQAEIEKEDDEKIKDGLPIVLKFSDAQNTGAKATSAATTVSTSPTMPSGSGGVDVSI